MNNLQTPTFLYKILSIEHWTRSQGQEALQLPEEDGEFIHFSTKDQLERIVTKYWGHVPRFVVLKIDVSLLTGDLVLEANPGGSAQYYHLYNGSIPLAAVSEMQVIDRQD